MTHHGAHPPRQHAGWNAIIRHYEGCLATHGATPAGVDWPNGADLAARFGVMLTLLADCGERPQLLDVGCGPGLILDYLAATDGVDRVNYHGIDLSNAMIEAARTRWPTHEFSCRDIVAVPLPEQSVDIVIMNGVLTERVSLSVESMTTLAEALVATAFRTARIGIAFNVMNAHVDWQRDDLFHWPFDALATFLKREIGPNYAFRADYGLYEYTCFVWRGPRRPAGPTLESWWGR
jgi:SAM-dependent methyltransferase